MEETYKDGTDIHNEAERLADGPTPGNSAAEAGAMAGADPNSIPGDHTPDQVTRRSESDIAADDEIAGLENDSLADEEFERQVDTYADDNQSAGDTGTPGN